MIGVINISDRFAGVHKVRMRMNRHSDYNQREQDISPAASSGSLSAERLLSAGAGGFFIF